MKECKFQKWWLKQKWEYGWEVLGSKTGRTGEQKNMWKLK